MKKRIEFPLFELILLIIVLLTLIIFALPKWTDIGTEARIKALNATALNIGSANRLLYSRSVIKNTNKNALQDSNILGEEEAGAYLVYGELRANESDLGLFLDGDFIDYEGTKNEGEIRLYLGGYKNNRCHIIYYQAQQITDVDGQTSIKKAHSRVKSTGC